MVTQVMWGKDLTSLVRSPITTAARSVPFDSWIDDLVEFQETVLPAAVTTNLTIAEALLKLEANKDIPSITIPDFDGDPLSYTDFVDHFKIHIHNKTHLTDDARMIQLRMRIKDAAERALAGLDSIHHVWNSPEVFEGTVWSAQCHCQSGSQQAYQGRKNNEKQQASSARIFSRHHELFGHYASPRLLRRHQRQ